MTIEAMVEALKARFVYSEQAALVDWGAVKEAFERYRKEGFAPSDVAEKVFSEVVLRQLFHGGEPVKPQAKPGLQTQVTPEVEAWARSFLPNPGEATVEQKLAALNAMIEAVNGFQKIFFKGGVELFYSKQTAHDVIVTRRIPTIKGIGCSHACVALIGALRALGIECKYVRTVSNWYTLLRAPGGVVARENEVAKGGPHSVVVARVGNDFFVADPWFRRAAVKVGDVEARRIEDLKAAFKWFEGVDQWGLGILSVKDFFKYVGKPRPEPGG